MQTKKAKEGYLLVSRKEGSLSVTDRVSAPDGTDLTNWEELPRRKRENWNECLTRKRILIWIHRNKARKVKKEDGDKKESPRPVNSHLTYILTHTRHKCVAGGKYPDYTCGCFVCVCK